MVNSTVEKLTPTRVKLHITVSPDELKPSIAHAYEHIAEDVQIPGFRKGKVPAPIIDQRIGRGAVLEHAVSEGLDTFYRQAVEANELRVLGRPSADVVEWPNEKDFTGDLLVEVEVDVRPEFELPTLEGTTVEIDAVEVDDAAIDEELDRLRARFGTLVTVDRPAATGDFVELDLVATIDTPRSTAPKACRTRSARANCSKASTRRSTRSPPGRTPRSARRSSAATTPAKRPRSR